MTTVLIVISKPVGIFPAHGQTPSKRATAGTAFPLTAS
jgi:hypothetical protein